EIYQRYLALRSVPALAAELSERGIRSKQWITQSGRKMGGHPFVVGALRHLLRNRLYLGEIPHKDLSYPGQHPAIIPAELFAAVQAQLAANTRDRRDRPV